MDWEFDEALDGHIAVLGKLDDLSRPEWTLGLAFGDHPHAAVTTLWQSLSLPFEEHRNRFINQWRRATKYCRDIKSASGDGGRLFHLSHNLLMALEDKTYQGARIASPSIPWGQSKGDEDQGGYHLVWSRDMVQTAMALLACSGTENPRRSLIYLASSQMPDGGFAQNFWLDGTPNWVGVQLDQAAFPVLLAWRLWKEDGLDDFDPYPMIKSAAAYLIRMGPATEQERWEEASGYSPSTLASNIAALVCAANFARVRGDDGLALFMEEYADFLESHLDAWTVTTQGILHPQVKRHYVRILPAPTENPEALEDPDRAWLELKNQPPGAPLILPARDIVDAGFLELVRYGIRSPGDALVEDSLKVVDAFLKVDTPRGASWLRYNFDGYGERPDGGPYTGWGRGRAWPLLTGERGHYELAAGRDPVPYLRAMESFATPSGFLPEQVWDEDRPDLGKKKGQPTGSACPLAWAHGEYVKLLRSVKDGRVFDLIDPVKDRYRLHRGRTDLEIWKPTRHVGRIFPGQTLRIMAPASFLLRWSPDEWKEVLNAQSLPSGLEIQYVDIPISVEQRSPIRFTFFWGESATFPFFRCKRDTWEGTDYCVSVGASE